MSHATEFQPPASGPTPAGVPSLDALVPAEVAKRAEAIGVRKAGMDGTRLFALAVLAGAFIALGAVFSIVALAGSGGAPWGVMRVLAGFVFSLGLILVIVGGAELFTGNALVIMAWASRRVRTRALLRNWSIVFAGNAAGAIGTALLVLLARTHTLGDGAVGETALGIAASKSSLGFAEAFARGVLCNALVCLAVWLTYAARGVGERILAIVFPIAAFVAAGFEHSIANLFFVPLGIGIQLVDPAFASAHGPGTPLGWGAFLAGNLLPVTLGNVVGGALLVGGVYWLVYLRAERGAP